MAFEVPVNDFDPEKYDTPAAGRYHLCVDDVEEDGGEKGEMIVHFEVVAGTVPNQEGKKIREYFAKSAKAFGKIHQLALALGMVSAEDLKRMKAEGRSPTYDFPGQIGQQLHGDLQEEEYNGKKYVKIGYRLYRIDDPRCASWPKNAGMLKQAGIVVPPVPPPASNGQTPAATPEVNLAGIV